MATRPVVIDLDELIPEPGDTVTLINRGPYLEVVHLHLPPSQEVSEKEWAMLLELTRLRLTSEDVEAIRSGTMVWH